MMRHSLLLSKWIKTAKIALKPIGPFFLLLALKAGLSYFMTKYLMDQ